MAYLRLNTSHSHAPFLDQRDFVGADHMLMGSDHPQAEGLADPSAYIKDVERFGADPADSKLVMRDNGYALAQGRPT